MLKDAPFPPLDKESSSFPKAVATTFPLDAMALESEREEKLKGGLKMDIESGTLHVIGKKETLDRRLPQILCSLKYAFDKTPEFWPPERPKVGRVTDEYLAVSFKTRAGYMPPLAEPAEYRSLPIDLSVSTESLFFLDTWVDEREEYMHRHAYIAVDRSDAASRTDPCSGFCREENAQQFVMAVKHLSRAPREEGPASDQSVYCPPRSEACKADATEGK